MRAVRKAFGSVLICLFGACLHFTHFTSSDLRRRGDRRYVAGTGGLSVPSRVKLRAESPLCGLQADDLKAIAVRAKTAGQTLREWIRSTIHAVL